MTEPTPIVVTDEIRRAVYEADCLQNGHIIDFGSLFITEGSDGYIPPQVDPDKLPHLRCSRCGKVWILLEEAGLDYSDAETKLTNKLKANDSLTKKIKERKERRLTGRGRRHLHTPEELARRKAEAEAAAEVHRQQIRDQIAAELAERESEETSGDTADKG